MAIATPTIPWTAIPTPADAPSVDPSYRFVHAGDVVFSRAPAIFTTVLGSCISVCLFDRRNRWGGINHFANPSTDRPESLDCRYGTPAIAALLDRFLLAGSQIDDIEARLAGGGHILARLTMRMGERNIQEALEQLDIWSIPVVGQDVDGPWTRRIWFDTYTGRVRCVRTRGDSSRAYRETMRLFDEFHKTTR